MKRRGKEKTIEERRKQSRKGEHHRGKEKTTEERRREDVREKDENRERRREDKKGEGRLNTLIKG